jgi:hypothetical protein
MRLHGLCPARSCRVARPSRVCLAPARLLDRRSRGRRNQVYNAEINRPRQFRIPAAARQLHRAGTDLSRSSRGPWPLRILNGTPSSPTAPPTGGRWAPTAVRRGARSRLPVGRRGCAPVRQPHAATRRFFYGLNIEWDGRRRILAQSVEHGIAADHWRGRRVSSSSTRSSTSRSARRPRRGLRARHEAGPDRFAGLGVRARHYAFGPLRMSCAHQP